MLNNRVAVGSGPSSAVTGRGVTPLNYGNNTRSRAAEGAGAGAGGIGLGARAVDAAQGQQHKAPRTLGGVVEVREQRGAAEDLGEETTRAGLGEAANGVPRPKDWREKVLQGKEELVSPTRLEWEI